MCNVLFINPSIDSVAYSFLLSTLGFSESYFNYYPNIISNFANLFYIIIMSSLFAVIFLFLLTPIPTFQQCKVDDPACTRCTYVPIFILSQLYVFTVCESCTVNRSLNPQTNMCICNNGFYSSGATTCNKCPAACSSCES